MPPSLSEHAAKPPRTESAVACPLCRPSVVDSHDARIFELGSSRQCVSEVAHQHVVEVEHRNSDASRLCRRVDERRRVADAARAPAGAVGSEQTAVGGMQTRGILGGRVRHEANLGARSLAAQRSPHDANLVGVGIDRRGERATLCSRVEHVGGRALQRRKRESQQQQSERKRSMPPRHQQQQRERKRAALTNRVTGLVRKSLRHR